MQILPMSVGIKQWGVRDNYRSNSMLHLRRFVPILPKNKAVRLFAYYLSN